jgi:hypothetical protein
MFHHRSGLTLRWTSSKAFPRVHAKIVTLTVVDRFSKQAHFLALSHPYTAAMVTKAFFNSIVRLHEFPTSIVSDQTWCSWETSGMTYSNLPTSSYG